MLKSENILAVVFALFAGKTQNKKTIISARKHSRGATGSKTVCLVGRLFNSAVALLSTAGKKQEVKWRK